MGMGVTDGGGYYNSSKYKTATASLAFANTSYASGMLIRRGSPSKKNGREVASRGRMIGHSTRRTIVIACTASL